MTCHDQSSPESTGQPWVAHRFKVGTNGWHESRTCGCRRLGLDCFLLVAGWRLLAVGFPAATPQGSFASGNRSWAVPPPAPVSIPSVTDCPKNCSSGTPTVLFRIAPVAIICAAMARLELGSILPPASIRAKHDNNRRASRWISHMRKTRGRGFAPG
jgi:hypothetical protein